MTRQTASLGLAVFLSIGLAPGIHAQGGTATMPGPIVKSGSFPQAPRFFSMKLKAGGQLDPGVSVSFAGQATHLAQFTASAVYDASIDYYRGTLVVSPADSINWLGTITTGPAGDGFFLNFGGGTGKYLYTQGHLAGTVAMDPDSMFTMDLEGDVVFVDSRTVDVTPCSRARSYCQLSCEESTYIIGVCMEADGTGSAISIECCCCTDGWRYRSFIGG